MTIDHNAQQPAPKKPVATTASFSSPESFTSTLSPPTSVGVSPTMSNMSLRGFAGQSGLRPYKSPLGEPPSKPVGNSFGSTTPLSRQVLIRRLPADTTEERLRLMLLFSQEFMSLEMLPSELSPDVGLCSALVTFNTASAAQQAKNMLDGKSPRPNEAELVVEIVPESPIGTRPPLVENVMSTQPTSSLTSPGAPSRQPARFNEMYQSFDNVATTSNGLYPINDHSDAEYYQNIFSPQSPIGNHLTNQTQSLGKNLIHDTAEDDETRELLKDPIGYAENGATQQRRATAPHLPIGRLTSLSLNTSTNGNGPITPYHHPNLTPLSAQGNTMSPTAMNGANHSTNYQMMNFRGHNFPPVNPADQNPPCNTLYVGNLPIDTSEEELKAMFQKQRGYKRLCFRTKQNGPMCFVEFEDVTLATRALHELYGKPLHNSFKGGIRLSFSKNPLGVRTGQPTTPPVSGSVGMNGMMGAPGNGFLIANRPPPGLATPPGLSRLDFNGNTQPAPNGTNAPSGYPGNNNHWGGPPYNGHSPSGGSSPPNGNNQGYKGPFNGHGR
ncbi:hypothetical protein F5Y14DRAFT_413523 [Nemania sp. NC0429]|nr:hypothetical protein F5Y14DRAFT_413523 [Nemania sp. NC0429]